VQTRAKHNGIRRRLAALATCALALSTNSLEAQLNFSPPANRPAPAAATLPSMAGVRSLAEAAPAGPTAAGRGWVRIAPNAPPLGQTPGVMGAAIGVPQAVQVTAGEALEALPAAPSAGPVAEPIPAGEATMGAETASPAAIGPPAAMGPDAGIMAAPPAQAIPFSEGQPLEATAIPDWQGPVDNAFVETDQATLFSTNHWFRRGFWYSQVDAVVLLRTELESTYFAADQSFKTVSGAGSVNDTPIFTGRPALSTDSVAPTFQPGLRLTLGRFLGQDTANRDHSIEVGFLGLFHYEDQAQLESYLPGGIQTALAPGAEYLYATGIHNSSFTGFSGADLQTVAYSSDFNGGEVNMRISGRPTRDRMNMQPNGQWVRMGTSSHLRSFLLGARYVSLDERFRYESFIDDALGGVLQVETTNNMFGPQCGIELNENYTNWGWGLRGKFAGMYNFSTRDSLQDRPEIDSRSEGLERNNFAPLMEAGLTANYQIRPNLVIRAAYDALYITGVANAISNARVGDRFPDYEVTADALFHGASLGLEMFW